MFGLIGWRLYALAGVLVVIAGLGLAVAYYKNSAARAQAEATLARDQRDRAIEAVKESEAANQRLRELGEALNAAIVERDRRAKVLEEARRKLKGEIDELKRNLPEADQSCLDRPLPAPIADLLRGRPSAGEVGRAPAGSPSPADAVPRPGP